VAGPYMHRRLRDVYAVAKLAAVFEGPMRALFLAYFNAHMWAHMWARMWKAR